MSPSVLQLVTSASKVNLIPSLVEVTNSESLSSTRLQYRTVTHDSDNTVAPYSAVIHESSVTHDNKVPHDSKIIQRIVTEPITSYQETTIKPTRYTFNVEVYSSNPSSFTKRRNIPTKPAKENKRFRSRKHSKGANQKSRNISESAPQTLTISRMYASRSNAPEFLTRFQVRIRVL